MKWVYAVMSKEILYLKFCNFIELDMFISTMTTTPCSTPSNGNITSNSSTNINGKGNTPGPRPSATLHQGFVAALKDTFGFIETISHDKEIFFHFR